MKHWLNPRLSLVLLAAAASATCAKVEDKAPAPTGGGGSGGTSSSPTTTHGAVTTTVSTAAASTATSAASTAGSNTSAGGTGMGEAGAPTQTSTTGEGGETASGGTGGTDGTGGVPPDVIDNARIVLLYKVDNSNAASASVFMHLYLRNQGDDEFPLNAAEVRYWLDPDGLSYALASHYQGPGIGPVTLDRGDESGDEYVAITFGSAASLPANTSDINSNEFQVKLDASQGTFDQSNDFSFAPELNTPTEHLRVTVYLADRLVWGCEPSGVCADDEEPGAGGAAGAAGAEGR